MWDSDPAAMMWGRGDPTVQRQQQELQRQERIRFQIEVVKFDADHSGTHQLIKNGSLQFINKKNRLVFKIIDQWLFLFC